MADRVAEVMEDPVGAAKNATRGSGRSGTWAAGLSGARGLAGRGGRLRRVAPRRGWRRRGNPAADQCREAAGFDGKAERLAAEHRRGAQEEALGVVVRRIALLVAPLDPDSAEAGRVRVLRRPSVALGAEQRLHDVLLADECRQELARARRDVE